MKTEIIKISASDGAEKYEKAVELLREFYYEKNGKECTIEFLEFIVRKLKEGEDNEK